ncbi:RNA polymerase recycling motor ATPase HelR [Humibacter antri]
MNEQTARASQIKHEQDSLDATYRRLDAEVSLKLSARDRALRSPIDDPTDRFAKDAEVAQLTDDIRRLRAAEHSLCFGRIDEFDRGRSLRIGRIGLRTEAGELLLIDWRAEAARPFYSATMASPMGVRRRRHLRLDRRVVVDISDEILDGTSPTSEDLVGDDPLISALSTARTGRMHEAAATLQAEQDEIVRSPYRGVMVVDGGPGTGKTIVALHRAAYVLYAFPSIADRGVLVFGPNRRFLDYISNVLPSLGENDVRLSTQSDVVGSEARRDEPDSVARIKGRAVLAEGLLRRVQQHQPHGVPLEFETADGAVVLEPTVVDAARRRALQGEVGHNRARERFTEYIVDELVNELERRTTKDLSDFEEELEALLGVDLDRLTSFEHPDEAPGEAESTGSALEIDWESIRDDLLGDPAIDRAISRVWPRLDAEHVVRAFLADLDMLAALLPDAAETDLALLSCDGEGWSDGDLALVDEARAIVDGLPDTMYGHIVVDEAQQLTEMQWRMLMRRSPGRSMTIVGDLAQSGPTTTIGTWAQALNPFVGERFVHHRLTVNYRTTSEILKASEPLLAVIAPDQQLSRSIRHGEEPSTITVSEEAVIARLNELIDAIVQEYPGELIGVVASTERSLALVAETRLAEAVVIAAPEARGLEFDTVIIVDAAGVRAAGDAGLRDLYVAQTRATKRLLIVQPTTSRSVGLRAR